MKFSKLGNYTVTASYNCNRVQGSDSVAVRVGIETETSITSVVRSSRGFTVSGLVSSNSVGVSNMSGEIVITDATDRQYRVSVRTNASGRFQGTVSIRRFVEGSYSVDVSFRNSSTHFGSSDTDTN